MVLPTITTGVLFENDKVDGSLPKLLKKDQLASINNFGTELRWRNLIYYCLIQTMAFYGIYLAFTSAKIATNLFAFFLFEASKIGITAGAHRLWSHRAYKATWQLRVLLMILNSIAMEGHIFSWARDHRVHHKYTDTNADPYCSKKGLYFCHIGWIFRSKHPDVKEKGKGIDMSDLNADPVVTFQKTYYWILMPLFCWILPTMIPVYFWNESWLNAMHIPANLRMILILHTTFLVNSAAHYIGYKPYDRNITPVNNLPVAIIAGGEGWHNYHHTFPWDYKTSELGNYSLNTTNAFIDFFAWIGWAYDLKSVSSDIIKKRVQRTGDGSHQLWGWNDKDMTEKDKEATVIT